MARITVKDVRSNFARLDEEIRPVLKEGEKLVLQEGSQTCGRAWRIYVVKPDGTGAQYEPPFPNYIGWTAAEAHSTIWSLRHGIGVGRKMGGES